MQFAELKTQAVECVENANLDAARPLWIKVCELAPHDIENWLVLSAIDQQLGFYQAALDHLQYPLQLTQDDPDVWLQSARLNWQLGRHALAQEQLYKALALDIDNYAVRKLAAAWCLQCGNFTQATNHYGVLQQHNELDSQARSNAVAAAYLARKFALLSQWTNREGGSAEFLSCVAQTIVSYQPPTQATLLKPRNEFHRQLNTALELCISSPAFFSATAHTRAQYETKTQALANRRLAKKIKQALPNDQCALLEIGSATGRFGEALKQEQQRHTLTGVCFNDPELHSIASNNAYDGVLHWRDFSLYTPTLLAQADALFINYQTPYYLDQYEELNALLRQFLESTAEQNATAKLVFVFLDNRHAHFAEQLQKQYSRSGTFNSQKLGSNYLLSIGAIRKARQKRCVYESKEKFANLLIHAAKLLSRSEYEQAEKVAQQVIDFDPNCAQAYYILGTCAQNQKNHRKAIGLFRKALYDNQYYYAVWVQIGTVWQALRRPRAAIRAYQKCLHYSPSHRLALQNMASIRLRLGHVERSANNLRSLILQYPFADRLQTFAKTLAKQDSSGQIQQSVQNLFASEQWLNVQFHQAIKQSYFERASRLLAELELKIEADQYKRLRAKLLEKTGKLNQAIELLNTLIKPDDKDSVNDANHLRSIVQATGDLERAKQLSDQTWDLSESRLNELQGRLFFANYFDFVGDQELADQHKAWGSALSQSIKKSIEKSVEKNAEQNFLPVLANKKRRSKRVRVGYVSGDFKAHSVAMFLYNIYKYHDKRKFEIYSYSTHDSGDGLATKLRFFSDHWRDISKLNDEQAAALIRKDQIDVLVDLSGHTGHNRLPLFVHRPAPAQCTYLGYANTTGLAEMDYRFTDRFADPESDPASLHSEKLLRLQNGFLGYSRHAPSPPVMISPVANQHRNYTYVCCNNIQKMNFRVVAVFAEILNRNAGSTLLVKAHNLNNPVILKRYRDEFTRLGVAEERVHLMNSIDMSDHQSLYNHTSIALDPWPYNGTTTSCDALWMGVPMLTLRGTRHAARVGVSILSVLGLSEWIAEDVEDYINKAVDFAKDTSKLHTLKLTMRKRMLDSTLMQADTTCRELEQHYLEIAKR